MKKYLSALFIIQCIMLVVYGQDDFDKVRKEYENLVKNPKGIHYGNNKAVGKYYDIRGFKMYCEVYGKGQPLLIIHGNGGSIDNFVKQIPYFSTKYKVIIADSRAQGKSKDSGDSLTYEMMADDYAALLDVMKIDSANVIGWSDGGINGLLLAIRHPRKVKKLAITGANLVPDTSAVPQGIWDMVRPMYAGLKSKTNKSELEQNTFKLFRLLCEEPHIDVSQLQKIYSPTLVIGGDYDVIKPSHTLLIFENIPRAYLWILPNSGHSTPIVYSQEFNKKIDNFFSSPFRKIDNLARFF